MPSYKLLNDVLLDGEIKKRGTIVEMSENDAAPYLERGSLGPADTELDNRTYFEKLQGEGTPESNLIKETEEREAAAQAKAKAEAAARLSKNDEEDEKTPSPLVGVQSQNDQTLQGLNPQNPPAPMAQLPVDPKQPTAEQLQDDFAKLEPPSNGTPQ
jgi:hypothetical protein